MNRPIKLLELFGGIGACSRALDHLGIEYEIADYVEINKYAVKSYNAIHNTNFQPQDIKEWNKDIDVDLIMHGSPCQDFSTAGKNKGGDEGSGTRSSLMYETIRIIEKLKPKYVIWENVKNLISEKHKHNFSKYLRKLEALGYVSNYKVLNSKDYGIPQNRERIFTISIRNDIKWEFTFPKKEPLKLRLRDLLEKNVDEKYFLSEKQLKDIQSWNSYEKPLEKIINIQQEQANTPTITTRTSEYTASMILIATPEKTMRIKNATNKGYLEAQEGDGVDISSRMATHRGTVQKGMAQTLNTNQDGGVVVKEQIADKLQELVDITKEELRIRKLTPYECWALMGFDKEAYDKASQVNSNAQLYIQAGNSIVVNVLEKILTNLLIKEEKDIQLNIFDLMDQQESELID